MAYKYYNKNKDNKEDAPEIREFPWKLVPLMTEEEKSAPRVPIETLAYDFFVGLRGCISG